VSDAMGPSPFAAVMVRAEAAWDCAGGDTQSVSRVTDGERVPARRLSERPGRRRRAPPVAERVPVAAALAR
jgi:hypothetical protein